MIWYLGSSEVLWENKNKDRKEGRLMGWWAGVCVCGDRLNRATRIGPVEKPG